MEILFINREIVELLKSKGTKGYKIVRNQPTITTEFLDDTPLTDFTEKNYSERDWDFIQTEIGDVSEEEFKLVWQGYETKYMSRSELESIIEKAFG